MKLSSPYCPSKSKNFALRLFQAILVLLLTGAVVACANSDSADTVDNTDIVQKVIEIKPSISDIDDLLTKPPANLEAVNVPQFVVIGFDDNTTASGLQWATDLFSDKRNPSGLNQKTTFDGTEARVSFYMNTARFLLSDSGKSAKLIEKTRALYEAGHEIGNHTHSHHADINQLPWNKFQQTLKNMSVKNWSQRIRLCQTTLSKYTGIPIEELSGYRAPYLAYTQPMMTAVASNNLAYDCSIEEGYAEKFDGTNFRWPYQMNNIPAGHTESWRGSKYNPDKIELTANPGLWQIPNHVLIIPDDSTASRYGIKQGLWARMIRSEPSLQNHRITGFDYNLWVKAKLNKTEVAGILKYNLDLRLTGNRAPFMFGAHSQYYTDDQWAKKHVPNASASEMREAIEEFVDYALSKPMVRIRPAIDILRWVRNPVPMVSLASLP